MRLTQAHYPVFSRPASSLRTFLVLGRVSNLPTVWSDCLAAWLLAGGGNPQALACAALAASLLYEAGMFLNDACDADFDRHHRRSRPIPSGAISELAVWRWGFLLLALGLTTALCLGMAVFAAAAVLAAFILLYNYLHKWTPFSPFLMGLCRLCVYLMTAATGRQGIGGEVVWKGLALAAYVAGLSCLARGENSRRPVEFWPALFLATPIFFAALIDNGAALMQTLVCSLVLAGWSTWALSWSLGQSEPKVGFTVSRLLAGVVLVDVLAVAGNSGPWVGFFAVWFALALVLQRYIPAT
jgi:4-hydroxybenzoate polyprenyltransferase